MTMEHTAAFLPQIFYNIAIFSTILFVIKLVIFSIFGGEAEVSADFNTEFETETAFDFISVQSLLAFLMGFGWMGYAGLIQLGLSELVSIFSAIGVGLFFMFSSAYLMFLVKKLEKNVRKDKVTALNKTGKAYSNFEPNGRGQIEVEINGQLTVADAINLSDENILAFETIEVVKVEDNILYVKKKG